MNKNFKRVKLLMKLIIHSNRFHVHIETYGLLVEFHIGKKLIGKWLATGLA